MPATSYPLHCFGVKTEKVGRLQSIYMNYLLTPVDLPDPTGDVRKLLYYAKGSTPLRSELPNCSLFVHFHLQIDGVAYFN